MSFANNEENATLDPEIARMKTVPDKKKNNDKENMLPNHYSFELCQGEEEEKKGSQECTGKKK